MVHMPYIPSSTSIIVSLLSASFPVTEYGWRPPAPSRLTPVRGPTSSSTPIGSAPRKHSIRRPSTRTVTPARHKLPEANSSPKCASRRLAGIMPRKVATAKRQVLSGVSPSCPAPDRVFRCFVEQLRLPRRSLLAGGRILAVDLEAERFQVLLDAAGESLVLLPELRILSRERRGIHGRQVYRDRPSHAITESLVGHPF